MTRDFETVSCQRAYEDLIRKINENVMDESAAAWIIEYVDTLVDMVDFDTQKYIVRCLNERSMKICRTDTQSRK